MARRQADSDFTFLTVREAAEYLKVSDSTMRRWIVEGRIATVKLGRLRRIRSDDLRKAINSGLKASRSKKMMMERRFPRLISNSGIFKLIGIGESGLPDVGEKHDRYAAEGA